MECYLNERYLERPLEVKSVIKKPLFYSVRFKNTMPVDDVQLLHSVSKTDESFSVSCSHLRYRFTMLKWKKVAVIRNGSESNYWKESPNQCLRWAIWQLK